MIFKVTPKASLTNFTEGKEYDVLETGKDLNSQPTILTHDDSMNLRIMEPEKFRYVRPKVKASTSVKAVNKGGRPKKTNVSG